MKNNIIAFVGGFITAAAKTYLMIESNPFLDVVFKGIATLIFGFIGGLAGLASKDVYKYFKSKIKK